MTDSEISLVRRSLTLFNERRYASAEYAVVVCPSVCPSVCHTPVLYQNG